MSLEQDKSVCPTITIVFLQSFEDTKFNSFYGKTLKMFKILQLRFVSDSLEPKVLKFASKSKSTTLHRKIAIKLKIYLALLQRKKKWLLILFTPYYI